MGVGFEVRVLKLQTVKKKQTPSVCLQPKIQNSQLFRQHHIWLDAALIPAMVLMDLISKIVSQPQLNVILF